MLQFNQIKFFIVFIIALFFSYTVTGCNIMTVDTMKNQKLDPQNPPKPTRASDAVTSKDLANGVFIGLAMSGGGGRAANFSAAVMLELEKLGILNKVTVISPVSGSALPAAYYALYGNDNKRWNVEEIQKQFQKDFEKRWILSWFLPHNIGYYWLTNFSRSDIMKEVLDSNLFDKKTFGDIGTGQPRLLINATKMEGERFVFSEEQFEKIRSRIDTYPIANAVMASSAFPGAFHDITLKDYQELERYQHVIDGGPSDNLGTTTLLEIIKRLYSSADAPKGCFLIVVDAYPYPLYNEYVDKADTRGPFDFIFDTNVARSQDALLMIRRIDLLSQLNINVYVGEKDIDKPFVLNVGDEAIYPDLFDDKLRVECAVWHISLQRLLSQDFAKNVSNRAGISENIVSNVGHVVNSIPTRYKLKGRDPDDVKRVELNSEILQGHLFKAANYLINYDSPDMKSATYLKQVCDWFNERGLDVCKAGQTEMPK